jgi:hypothetical protein
MANIELYSRGMIKEYGEYKAQKAGGEIGVDELLFSFPDESLDSDVRLDRKIQSPYAVVYRDKDNQSRVRKFEAGEGQVYSVPRASEKTPVGEDLKDSLMYGMEGNVRYQANFQKMVRDITLDHVSGHNMLKWKQALDVIRTGIFEAGGMGGNDIGLDIDYSRAAGNSITADFSAVNFDDALAAMHDVLDAQGASKQNRILIAGASWIKEFSQDSNVRAFLDANNENTLLMQQMQAQQLNRTTGLFALARYRTPSKPSATWICEFNPDTSWVAYEGATAAPFVPDDEAMMCVLGARRWKVIRGVDTAVGGDRTQRVSGDIVFDAYHENDPPVDFMRSQSRHLYLPANINHTVRSTGSNFN